MPKPKPLHDAHVVAWRQDLARQWQYLPRSVYYRNRHKFASMSFDQAMDAGFMALTRAAGLFNSDFGFKFSTYASRAIFIEMTHQLGKLLLRQPFERKCMSLSSLCGREAITEGYDFDVVEAMPVDADVGLMTEDVMRALERLPESLQRAFLWNVRDGLTLRVIAERCGVSKERIRQRRDEAIRLLREMLGVGLAS